MPAHHSPNNNKRPRVDNNENSADNVVNDFDEPSSAVLYRVIMNNNEMLSELKEMFQYQFKENALMRAELEEIKKLNAHLLKELEKKEGYPNVNSDILTDFKDVRKTIQESLSKVSEQISNSPLVPKKPSYSSVAKSGNAVIVVKPKDITQSSDSTKSAVKNVINASEFKIQGVRNVNKGGIVIECDTKDEIEQLRKDAESKLGDNYEVTAQTGRCPKVKIIGFSSEVDDEQLLNSLIEQNREIFSGCPKPKIVHRFKTKKSNGMKLEVNGTVFGKLMSAKRIIIGWDTCIIHEAFDLLRCFKCCGYHHTSKSCSAPVTCSKCSLNHDIKECSSAEEKCINCTLSAKALKIDLNTNHSALSLECEVYKRKIESERKRIDYNFPGSPGPGLSTYSNYQFIVCSITKTKNQLDVSVMLMKPNIRIKMLKNVQ